MTWNVLAGWQHIALDGVVIVLLLIFGFKDGKKGFIECLFSLLSVLVSTLVAFLFMNLLLELTGGLFGIQTALENTCVRAFSNIRGFDFDVSNQGISTALADKNIPNFLIDAVVEEYGDANIPVGTTIAVLVGTSLGGIIAGLVAWIVLFFLTKILLILLKKFLMVIIQKISIVDKFNHVLGFLEGFFKALLMISAVLAVISLIPSAGLGAFFDQTLLVKWLYNHNPINEILSWILI